ncbi:hypothetical protein JH06_4944 [Blastocystis sp. subtype 4]|uniref:hypothetical protein n=1 Tax=Blastocystis sp. subtype 4 TaxID=944170 RepID=UPI000711FF7B|nr:hypothetical protein JH06_4944 [Blastocystis sp. subtype 4]KNB41730.1 hypothetical protein JH06_4944 [Blastocystis sp. subtype 4]|eukprot:XP_014525173.1 hypothetical protein JH06_4944 [Blastocystis sp. subtype 4]
MRASTAILLISLLALCSGYPVSDLLADSLKTSFLQSPVLVLLSYNTMVDNWKKLRSDFAGIVGTGSYGLDPVFLNNDCSVNPRICRYYRIEKLPSVLIIRKDGSVVRYTDDINDSSFLTFLSRNLNKPSGFASLSPIYIRVVLLIVIIVALIFLFMKSSKSPEKKSDIEEHAPLVDHPK